MVDSLIEHIKKNVPSGVVTRAQIEEITGGLITKSLLNNIDCDKKRKGIEGRMYAGRTVIYPVESLCDFLRDYIKK